MNTTRRSVFKGMVAAGALPLFNIGCAGFGRSRCVQIANGAKIRVALIGCGLQTHTMIDGVLCEDLVAIVDPDSEEDGPEEPAETGESTPAEPMPQEETAADNASDSEEVAE